ncbi:P-TEFb-associated cyclin-dependent protein kinase Cdk9 [Cotesia glomerata]|uniref:p-TEFb-associated cyclin-dependent protein kinase Cdk9 n=1 Tax=Cotesia glomerata TaxID=32391 RepID=A0AAV7I9H6_COTGL|nr:P-TEFb-associated cyclin-dependent protein kinase Cdk9 [Cotesia glomerata]
MKKILSDNGDEGFPITALRKIKILKLLKHENVVNLIEICRTPATQNNRYYSSFYLVFEFCEHDLAGLLSNANVKFNLGEIKKVMHQLFSGLYFIHSNHILHRDIKPANILVIKNGILKLADFGLARAFSARKSGQANRFTNRVVTLWYRPPELLLGDRNYGPSMDLWGAGCIMAEMWTRSPIFQGATEQKQLTLISQLCMVLLHQKFGQVLKVSTCLIKWNCLKDKKEELKTKPYIKNYYACDLLDKLLILDPSQRSDSDLALTKLNHDFFWTNPMPSDLSKMMTQHTQSMFELLERPRRLGPAQHLHGPIPPGAARPTMSVLIGGYQDRVF